MAGPSTSVSLPRFDSNTVQRIAVVAGGALLVITAAGAVYYAYRRNQPHDKRYFLQLAEQKKREGNELYRSKNYQGAIKLFLEAVSAVKNFDEGKELVANCYNNISACYEILENFDESIKYCSEAILISPNYYKVVNRRARLYTKRGQYNESLNDYFTVTKLCTTESQLKMINAEVDRLLQLAIRPALGAILKEMDGKFKKIPQYVIAHWLKNSVTKDPILLRCKNLNVNDSTNNLDVALIMLKKGKYDDVLPLALKVVNNNNADVVDRAEAVILSARMLHLHNQIKKAHEMIGRFDVFWEQLEKDQHVDLRVAYFVLMVTIAKSNEDASKYVEESLSFDPTNADPILAYAVRLFEGNHHDDSLAAFKRAAEIDPNQPFAKYYILYLNYILSLKRQAIDQVRAHIYSFDEALNKDENPPAFALILFAKVCMNSENADLAFASAKKVREIDPKNAYALFLCGILEGDAPAAMNDRSKMLEFVENVEKTMEKVLELDPNYWEPYRTLAKICLDKMDFDGANKNFDIAIELARNREDFEILLKDKILTNITYKQTKETKDKLLFSSQTTSSA